jgi:hypothetical protein
MAKGGGESPTRDLEGHQVTGAPMLDAAAARARVLKIQQSCALCG